MRAAGGGTAGPLAGAGSCTASPLAGAEAEAIGSEPLRRPRGRATQARQSADGCLALGLFVSRAHQKIMQKKEKKAEQNRTTFSEKYEGPRTNQRINVITITCLDPSFRR